MPSHRKTERKKGSFGQHSPDSPSPRSRPSIAVNRPISNALAKNPTGDERIRRRKSRERGNQRKYPESPRASPKSNKGRSDRSPSRKTDLRYEKNTARILAFKKGETPPRTRKPRRNRIRPSPKTYPLLDNAVANPCLPMRRVRSVPQKAPPGDPKPRQPLPSHAHPQPTDIPRPPRVQTKSTAHRREKESHADCRPA